MNAAHHLLYRRVTLEYGNQPAIEHRSHAVRDGGALDRAVVGALANKLLDRGARHQYLSDGPAASFLDVPYMRETWTMIQREDTPEAFRTAVTVLTRGIMAGLYVNSLDRITTRPPSASAR